MYNERPQTAIHKPLLFMPELPEVETTRRGIRPHIEGRRVSGIIIRQRQLRWPIPKQINDHLRDQPLESISRRGKYLLLRFPSGHLMIHLGMSGSLRILEPGTAAGPHDHVDILFDRQIVLRFTDPRRFGSILWAGPTPAEHPLLCQLGPEPLSVAFNPEYLFARSRGRRSAVKTFIMDSRIVPGVGNIYANEALFQAGLHPKRQAGRIALPRYETLVEQIRTVLESAIRQGGTTLRDFTGSDGRPGYFRQSLMVYGRGGEACRNCGLALREIRLGQRSTVYCTRCQR